jgi:serine/threonine protein kinase
MSDTPQSTIKTADPNCGGESSVLPTAPPFIALTPQAASAPAELDPRTYELLETLGQGGMGEVYRCSDPALGRDLAIKVMKASLRGHAKIEQRFLREARITGSLQHPGIVSIHNLGRLADGRLHYTMRLVRGQTFAAILKEEAGKPECLPYLLSIFEKICQAAAYAHSKRIIHRDLKPGNVMVGKFGEVQVMDWGLAKVLGSEDAPAGSEEKTDSASTRIATEIDTPVELTRTGSGFGTPAYMPPEQALGEWDAVDERADVFALGSILCELLTGQPAYRGSDGEEVYRRAKRGDMTEALERLHQCQADTALVALCRECLSAEREPRPRDAGVVAKRAAEHQAEVQERLRRAEMERVEEQLKAREERKRRRLLIASFSVVSLVLLTGAAVSTWQAVRATNAEAQAQKRLGQIEQANGVLASVFRDLDPHAEEKGGPNVRQQLSQHLERASAQLDEGAIGDPVTVARLQSTLGRSLYGLGRTPQAVELLSKSKTALESQLGADHPETLACCNHLGMAYLAAGRHDEAVHLLEQTAALSEAKLGATHSDTLFARAYLADAYLAAGRIPDSLRLHEQTLQQREEQLGADHVDTLASRTSLASVYGAAGRYTDAIRLHEQTLKQMEAHYGPDHPYTLDTRNNLAEAYREAGQIAKAIPLHEQTLQVRETKLGVNHPQTLVSRDNLALTYQSAGRIPDAIRLNEQNLKLYEAKLGSDHPDTLTSRNNLAVVYRAAGRVADAIRLHEPNLKQREAILGFDHPDTLQSRNNLAEGYRSVGRYADAIRLYEQNLKPCEDKLGADHPHTLMVMASLGMSYANAGQFKEALARLEEAAARARKRPEGFSGQLAFLPRFLASAYDQAGQFAKAEPLHRDLLKEAIQELGADDPRTARQMAILGDNLLHQQKYPEAETQLRAGLQVLASKQPNDWVTFNVRSLLGGALLGQKKYAKAEPLLLQGYEGLQQRQAKIPPQGKHRLPDALERLVRLYQATEQNEKVAQWQKRLDETKATQKRPNP